MHRNTHTEMRIINHKISRHVKFYFFYFSFPFLSLISAIQKLQESICALFMREYFAPKSQRNILIFQIIFNCSLFYLLIFPHFPYLTFSLIVLDLIPINQVLSSVGHNMLLSFYLHTYIYNTSPSSTITYTYFYSLYICVSI